MPRKSSLWLPKTAFKENLRRLTREWGTQTQIAAAVGVPVSSFNGWVSDQTHALPNVEQAFLAAKHLGVSIEELITGEPPTVVHDPVPPDLQRYAEALNRLPDAPRRGLLALIDHIAAGVPQEPTVGEVEEGNRAASE